MKKNLYILLLIFIVTLGCIFILVKKSVPEMPVMDISRNYSGIKVVGEDTIHFPFILSGMFADSSGFYVYSYRGKRLYHYNSGARSIDTLLHINTLYKGILSSLDRDPVTNIFYFFNGNTNRIYTYLPGKEKKDSLEGGKMRFGRAVKCFDGTFFLTQSLDFSNNQATLRKMDYVDHSDTALYSFAHFQDGGISSDGFFCKDAVSHQLFYIQFYNSEIIRYDERGNQVSKIITIDRTKPRNNSVPTEHGFTVDGKTKMLNLAATADSAHLYLLSGIASRENKELFGTAVDIYSTRTGRYENSLQFPYYKDIQVTMLEKAGDRLLVGFGNTIISYKIQFQ